MNIPKVENMTNANGNKVANQFIVTTDEGYYFQSYKTIIAFEPRHGLANTTLGRTVLDKDSWDYSVTTLKYLKIFLGLEHTSKKEIEKIIENGTYTLANLN